MTGLVDVLDEHSDAIAYDLLRCGARLRDFPDNGITWGDLLVLVRQAQPDTATYKALNPHWQQTAETDFLRAILHAAQIANWQRTEDGSKGRNAPDPFQWPWERDDGDQPDAMSWEEAADWLGWQDEMNKFFNN